MGPPIIDAVSEFAGEVGLAFESAFFGEWPGCTDRIFGDSGGMAIDEVVLGGSGFTVVASGVTGRVGIFPMGDFVCFFGEISGIGCLIEDGFPGPDAGVVAVTPDHLTYIVVDEFSELRVFVPELPAGSGDDHEEPQFVGCVHEGGILRVVGGTDDSQTGVAEFFRVAPLSDVGKGIAEVGKILVAVAADQLAGERLPVEDKSLVVHDEVADADFDGLRIQDFTIFNDIDGEAR